MKEILVSFATAIIDLFSENEVLDNAMIEEISDANDNSNDPAEIVMQVLNEIPEDDHEQMIQPVCDFVGKLSKENQISVFKHLGKSLNKVLYDEVEKVSSSTLSLVDLQNHNKEELYASIDERIIAFIDSLTDKSGKKFGSTKIKHKFQNECYREPNKSKKQQFCVSVWC